MLCGHGPTNAQTKLFDNYAQFLPLNPCKSPRFMASAYLSSERSSALIPCKSLGSTKYHSGYYYHSISTQGISPRIAMQKSARGQKSQTSSVYHIYHSLVCSRSLAVPLLLYCLRLILLSPFRASTHWLLQSHHRSPILPSFGDLYWVLPAPWNPLRLKNSDGKVNMSILSPYNTHCQTFRTHSAQPTRFFTQPEDHLERLQFREVRLQQKCCLPTPFPVNSSIFKFHRNPISQHRTQCADAPADRLDSHNIYFTCMVRTGQHLNGSLIRQYAKRGPRLSVFLLYSPVYNPRRLAISCGFRGCTHSTPTIYSSFNPISLQNKHHMYPTSDGFILVCGTVFLYCQTTEI